MPNLADTLESLNPEQHAAVTHAGGPAMVLAGAGSGKTRVLTARAAWLLAHEPELDASQLLLVTFTNKAAQEMGERIRELTQSELPFAGTFHKICARMLRAHAHRLGLSPAFVILDSDDQLDLLKDVYKQLGLSEKDVHPKAAKAAISTAKNEVVDVQMYAERAQSRYTALISQAYKGYQAALRANQALDFDDLLLYTVQLLQNHEDIRQQYQTQFRHVLIDEYQDTNKVQYLLGQLLAAPQLNLFVVGDFSQSIYAWRGADYRNMLSLQTDFPHMTTYRLERNYRSTQTILDAATHVVQKNTSHPILQLWTDQRTTTPITLYEADSGEDEAAKIAQYIAQRELDVPYSEKAVLYRTNAQSRAFEEAFLRASIPYRIVGGIRFYARKEIKDMLAYVRLYVNPNDALGLKRVAKLGKRALAEYLAWQQTQPLAEHPSPVKLIQAILEQTKYLNRFDTNDPEENERIANIEELINTASVFPDTTVFLEHVALIQDDEMANNSTTTDFTSSSAPTDRVTLMSMHAAKGLEFAVVCVVGMEEGLFPHSRALLEKDEMEEERRLCYVAITRAKQKLYLSYARRRLVYGTLTSNLPSRFLQDIPETLLQKEASDHYQRADRFGNTAIQRWNTAKWQRNPWGNASSSQRQRSSRLHATDPDASRRIVPLDAVDDQLLDDVLSGEIDISEYLKR